MNIKKFVYFIIVFFALNHINNSYCPIFTNQGFRVALDTFNHNLSEFETNLAEYEKDEITILAPQAFFNEVVRIADFLKPAADEMELSTPVILFFKSKNFLPPGLELKETDPEPFKKTIKAAFLKFIDDKIKELKDRLSEAKKKVEQKEIQVPLDNLIAIIKSIETNLPRGQFIPPMSKDFADLKRVYDTLKTKPEEVSKQIGKESSQTTLEKIDALMPVAKALDELLHPSTSTTRAKDILKNFFFDSYDSPTEKQLKKGNKGFFVKYKAIGVPATEVPIVKELIASFNELEILIKQLNESKTIDEDEKDLNQSLQKHAKRAIEQGLVDKYNTIVKEAGQQPIFEKITTYSPAIKIIEKINENQKAAGNIVQAQYQTELNNIIKTTVENISSLPNVATKRILDLHAKLAAIKEKLYGLQ